MYTTNSTDTKEKRMQQQEIIENALRLKYPEQVVLVVTCGRDGRKNVMAVGWTAIASGDPLMFMLGIDDAAYTYELIRATQSFVVAFPSEGMAAAVLHAGTVHGHKRDKLAESGLATTPALRVPAPLLTDAVANFECELVEIVQPGDCPLVFGRVVAAHTNTDPSLRRLYTVGPGHTMGGVRVAAVSLSAE
ncbi:MAG: flavin reductase family protein [Kiritimatiellae bacterium]|nr:flavin reductase family protein [Kiritimatiellia bacterium]